MFGQLHRRLHRHVAVQVAGVAAAHTLDALAAQAEGLAALRAFGQVDGGLALQGGHVDLAAEGGGGHAHRHLAVQVVALAFEDVVLAQPDLDVEVAGRAAILARFAVAAGADALAVVDARGDLDFQRLLLLDLALAAAGGAGLGNDLAGAVAVRAGLLHAEETLAHLHHALAVAGAAGLDAGARLGASALAGLAVVPAGDADLRFLAGGRFFQRDFHGVGQVRAAVHLPAATAAAGAAEDVAEDVAEGFAETGKAFRTGAARAAHVRVHAGVAVLVVGRLLLRVRQHLVGLFGLLELLFGALGGITLVAVRVVLHRQLAIRLLDLVVRSVLGHAQHFVKVAFGHGGQSGFC